jgi:hypothetical protein
VRASAESFSYHALEGGLSAEGENSLPATWGSLRPLFTVGHSILEFGPSANPLKDCGVGLVARDY